MKNPQVIPEEPVMITTLPYFGRGEEAYIQAVEKTLLEVMQL